MASEHESEQVEEDEVWGTVRSPCPDPSCDGTIPKNTGSCPECGADQVFNQGMYDFLVACAYTPQQLGAAFFERTDYTEDDVADLDSGRWNELRSHAPDGQIMLRAAELMGAELFGMNLENAFLAFADLRGSNLMGARCHRAFMSQAKLTRAFLAGATLTRADLSYARLKEANLERADLRRAYLRGARLQDADLTAAKFQGAKLPHARLQGTKAKEVVMDTETLLTGIHVDKDTYFAGVGLDNTRLAPEKKAHLRYNIRRKGWEKWYEHNWLRKTVGWGILRPLWAISDYGRSTSRILLVFLLLSLFFAALYTGVPHLVQVNNDHSSVTQTLAQYERPYRFVRATYFSVVTMTTLGFGDLAANPEYSWSNVVLSLHVLFGYVLLGALITRFAIMFQGESVPFTKHPTWIEWLRLDGAWERAKYRTERLKELVLTGPPRWRLGLESAKESLQDLVNRILSSLRGMGKDFAQSLAQEFSKHSDR